MHTEILNGNFLLNRIVFFYRSSASDLFFEHLSALHNAKKILPLRLLLLGFLTLEPTLEILVRELAHM